MLQRAFHYFGLVLICESLIDSVEGHSWMECADYRITNDNDRRFYNPNQCKGYPRCASNQKAAGFGVEAGLTNPSPQCQCPLNSANDYSPGTPMATYTQGQTVCLAFPPKNHVQDECKPFTGARRDIQDLEIRRSLINPTRDTLVWPKTYEDFTPESDAAGSRVSKGFMNCPEFCNNGDKALCTACFEIEDDLAPGMYTFQWWWTFTPAFKYSTCFDAEVVASGSGGSSGPSLPSSPAASSPSTPATNTSSGTSPSLPVALPSAPSSPSSDASTPAAGSPSSPSSSSACSAFFGSCSNGESCTAGSTCDGNLCTPDSFEYGTSCLDNEQACGAGWECNKLNDFYASCSPSAAPNCT